MDGLQVTFYLSGVVAIGATLLAITRLHAVHALLYLIVSLLAVATIFFVLGAPFIAALEVIIYAGAIVVLFVFVVMLLGAFPPGSPRGDLGGAAAERERKWLRGRDLIGPLVLIALLAGETVYLLARHQGGMATESVEPVRVGTALFGTYCLGVELASLLLLAGLVGAYHLGRLRMVKSEDPHGLDSTGARSRPGGDPLPRRTDRSPGSP